MRKLSRFWKTEPPSTGLKLFDIADLGCGSRQNNEAVIRALCATAFVGHDTALCRVLGRYKMFVDTRDLSISAHLMLDGYWEMWLSEALQHAVQPGMCAVDIGANVGYFTVLLADLVGPEGHVHAFEPNPGMLGLIRRSILVNGFGSRVSIHSDPLSDADGAAVTLSWDPEQPGGGYIHAGGDPPQAGVAELNSRRLDSYAELYDADIIKIDAEAAEQLIWRGASGILERHRPLTIFLEFTACRYADPAGFLDEIEAPGFSLGYVSLDAGMKQAGKADILALPATEDLMLVLTRA